MEECPRPAAAGPPGVPPALWACVAELNAAAGPNFAALPTTALRGLHSFSRAPKANLLAAFCQAGAGGASTSVPPLCLLSYVLSEVFHTYELVGLVRYELAAPAWLAPWAARWRLGGGAGGGDVAVLALTPFSACGAAHPTLFLPAFLPACA
jgi:hypothetical protein